MWHGLKVEVLSLKHRFSHRYLYSRQECRTFKSVASRPCDWLLLVLTMRARGATLTKTDGKIDEYLVRHLGIGQKLFNNHCLVEKTMKMCESSLTETYLKISKASSCRCIWLAGCLCYTRFLGKTLLIWYSQVGRRALVTFTKAKVHSSSSIIRRVIYRAMTHLDFVHEVGKLGGGMWLWGANQLTVYCGYTIKEPFQQYSMYNLCPLERHHTTNLE